jgi:hypothetical protein
MKNQPSVQPFLFLILFALPVCRSAAQSATPVLLASWGGFGQSSAGSVSASMGEPLVRTVGNNNGLLTQGFQQPEPSGMVSVQAPAWWRNWRLYPSPCIDRVTLMLDAADDFSAAWQLVSDDGRVVLSETSFPVPSGRFETSIAVENLPAGMYYFIFRHLESGQNWQVPLVKMAR